MTSKNNDLSNLQNFNNEANGQQRSLSMPRGSCPTKDETRDRSSTFAMHYFTGVQPTVRRIPKTLAEEGRLSVRKQSYLTRQTACESQTNLINNDQENQEQSELPSEQIKTPQLASKFAPYVERNYHGQDKIRRQQTNPIGPAESTSPPLQVGTGRPELSRMAHMNHQSSNLMSSGAQLERRLVDIYGANKVKNSNQAKYGNRLPATFQQLQDNSQNLKSIRQQFQPKQKRPSQSSKLDAVGTRNQDLSIVITSQDTVDNPDGRVQSHYQNSLTQFTNFHAHQQLWKNHSRIGSEGSVQSIPDAQFLQNRGPLPLGLPSSSPSLNKQDFEVIKPAQLADASNTRNDRSSSLLQSRRNFAGTSDIIVQSQDLSVDLKQQDQLESYFPQSTNKKLANTQRLSNIPMKKKSSIYTNLLPQYMKNQLSFNSHRHRGSDGAAGGSQQPKSSQKLYKLSIAEQYDENNNETLWIDQKPLVDCSSIDGGSVDLRVNSANEVARLPFSEDFINEDSREDVISPIFGSMNKYKEEARAISNLEVKPELGSSSAVVEKLKASSRNLAILAESIAGAQLQSPKVDLLKETVSTPQRMLNTPRKEKVGSLFRSPYGQRLPELTIKGEIKNQHKSKQQAQATNQQNKQQQELPEVVSQIKSAKNSAQKAALEFRKQQKPLKQDLSLESQALRKEEQSTEQTFNSEVPLENSQDNKRAHQQDMNIKNIQLQPVSVASAPHASNSALDGAQKHSKSFGVANMSFQSNKERYHANVLLYMNGGQPVRGQPKNPSYNVPQSPKNHKSILNHGNTAGHAKQWSPSKSSKTQHAESILTVSKDELCEEKLSPMRTFMVERNAHKNQLQGVHEYITSMTVGQPDRQNCTAPLDMLGQMTQALSTQANTTQPRQNQSKTITAIQNTSPNLTSLPSGTASSVAGQGLSQNVTLVQSKLLQNAKTRQFMRTNQLPNQKLGAIPSVTEQRNGIAGPSGYLGQQVMLTTLQQQSPSKMNQDMIMQQSSVPMQSSSPMAKGQHPGNPDGIYLKSVANQAQKFIQPSQIVAPTSFMALEKQFKPQLNQTNPSTQQSKISVASQKGAGVLAGSPSSNLMGMQQWQANQMSQYNPFIIDCNQASLPRSPPQSSKLSGKIVKQQKPLSEVRSSNNNFKNLQQKSTGPFEKQQSLLEKVMEPGSQHTNSIGAPNDPLVKALQYGSIGEYFSKTGVTQKAQKNYTKLKRVADFQPQQQTTHLDQLQVNQSTELNGKTLQHSAGPPAIQGKQVSAVMRNSADKSGNFQMILPAFINSGSSQQNTSSVNVLKHNHISHAPAIQVKKASGDAYEDRGQSRDDCTQSFAVIAKAASYSPRKSRKASQHAQSQPSGRDPGYTSWGAKPSTSSNTKNPSQVQPNKASDPSEAKKKAQNANRGQQSQNLLQSLGEAQYMHVAKNDKMKIDSGAAQLKSSQHGSQNNDARASSNRIVQASTDNLNGRASSLQVQTQGRKITGLVVQECGSARQLSAVCTDVNGKDVIADLASAYNETKLDTPVNIRGTARNLAGNKTHNMNTNSSDDEDTKEEQELPPLSQNHSEDNLNVATSRIKDREALQSSQNATDEKNSENMSLGVQRLSTHKATTKAKISHYQGNLNSFNRGRRMKRKQPARSIISSKPSLNSNFSRVNQQPSESQPQTQQNLQQNAEPPQQNKKSLQPTQQQPSLPIVASAAGQAVPAVHDLINPSSMKSPDLNSNKFVKDPRQIQSYYHQKGVIAKAVSSSHKQQRDGGAGDEYTAHSNHNQNQVLSEKGGSAGTPSVLGSSRTGTGKKNSRKESKSIGGVGTPLTQMKSQGKIIIKKSRGSQRCNSALRSPKAANGAPSSANSKENALKSSSGMRQPYKISNQDSAISSRSRPKTVTKAVSAASVGPSSSFSKQNAGSTAENRGQTMRATLVSGGKGHRGSTTEMAEYSDGLELKEKKSTSSKLSISKQNSVGLKQSIMSKREQPCSIENVANHQRKSSIKRAATVHPDTLDQEQNSGPQVEIKQTLNSSSAVVEKAKATKPSKIISCGPENQRISAIFNGPAQSASPTRIPRQLISKRQELMTNSEAKGTSDSKVIKMNSHDKRVFKASQVKRVRQMQSSQKTLEVVKAQTENAKPQSSARKEHQSATKIGLLPTTNTNINNLQTNSSMVSRSESVAAKTIHNNASASYISSAINEAAAAQPTNQQDLREPLRRLSSGLPVNQIIDEVKDENVLVNNGSPAKQIQIGKQHTPPSQAAAEYSEGSPMKLIPQQQMSAQEQQRLSTLAPKPGSSMQNQNGTRQYCDDEYVPSATNQPYSSCKAFVIIDSHHSKVLQCKNKDEVREMASLTKMMTAIVTLELAAELRMDIRDTYFKVSQRAATTIGTTANLVEGQVMSIWELLHGLMLPSGNDAAMVLAENFSYKLLRNANRSIKEDEDQPLRAPENGFYPFVKHMNKMARKIHMRLTNYANPHGLADKSNHSTALEQAQLANYCMRNENFRQIVNTKSFTSINYVPLKRCQKMPHYDFNTWQTYDERDVPFIHGSVPYVQYYQTWYNSNKLLEVPGFCGVKTGQTSTAGACLAIYYKNTVLNKNLITVVLGSKSVEYRWKDTKRLTLWADAVLMENTANRSGVTLGSPTKTNRKETKSGVRQLM